MLGLTLISGTPPLCLFKSGHPEAELHQIWRRYIRHEAIAQGPQVVVNMGEAKIPHDAASRDLAPGRALSSYLGHLVYIVFLSYLSISYVAFLNYLILSSYSVLPHRLTLSPYLTPAACAGSDDANAGAAGEAASVCSVRKENIEHFENIAQATPPGIVNSPRVHFMPL